MPLDINSAVDTLIKRGWNDNDIKDVVGGIQSQTDELIKAGKSDEEIQNVIGATKLKDQQGDIQLFNPTADIQKIVTEGFQNAPNITNIQDVKPPTMMQNIMSGPVGGAIESGLTGISRAAPFPGLIKLLTGQDTSQYGMEGGILNPLPEILTDPVSRGIEGLAKVSPGLAKLASDTIMASPAFHNFSLQSLKNIGLYTRFKPEVPVDVSTLRDVSPTSRTGAVGTRFLESPITNERAPVNSEGAVSSVPPLKSQPPAKLGQPGEIQPAIDPITIEFAKNLREYALKIPDNNILAEANKILDQVGIPERQRIVPPEQVELARSTAIEVAAEAKRHATEVNDPILLNRANQIINNNGLIKPEEILNPSVHDTGDLSADLNIIINDKKNLDTSAITDLNTKWLKMHEAELGTQQSVLDMVNNEYTIDSNKVVKKPITAEHIIPDKDIATGQALTKRAVETNNISGAPTINDIDYTELTDRVFKRRRDIPPDMGGNIPPPDDILSLPLPEENKLRGLPYHGKIQAPITVFANLEAESKIPFLTELHNTKQIADANYTQMQLKLQQQLKDTIREVGKYDRPTKKNIEARIRISDILEQIQSYDKKNDIVFYKDTNGAISQHDPNHVAVALKADVNEVEVAARLRWLYDEWWKQGATKNAINPNAYLDFYNPKKMTEQQRFDYVKNLRDDQRAFFQYPRTQRVYKQERDAIKLANRYLSEWARTDHLIPWQKQVAEPIYKQAMAMYKDSPRKLETLNYTKNYILDTLRLPRDTAMNANTALYDFVKNWVSPKSKYTGDMILRRFGEDRLGEGVSRGINTFFLNYYLRYRPVPAIRNAMQREFALPLLPGGNMDLMKSQIKLFRSKDAQDKFLASGLMPYLENEKVTTAHYDMFQHAETGNMATPFLAIHDGIVEDFKKGISLTDMQKKYRLHLYPDPLQERFADLYKRGLIGDIRELGPVDNGAALLGRYASMMTQFPKGPGETPEYARTGPVAKSFWLFSTWSPMSLDYFSHLIKDAATGPKSYTDLFRVGKIFAYLYMADKAYEGLTGNSLQSNPLTNMPNRVVQAPGPGLGASIFQYVTSKWNELINGILQEDDKGLNKYLADKAAKEITRSTPGMVRDIQSLTGSSKKKEVKSIAP